MSGRSKKRAAFGLTEEVGTLYPTLELDREFVAPWQASSTPSMWKTDPQGLNILCLDGGGVRSLSELVIVSEVMGRLGEELGALPKPADRFDIIAGSGSGGVIACMLGRLRMPAKHAAGEYAKLILKAFSERKSIGSGGMYVGSNLREALKAMVKGVTGNEDEKMLEEVEGGCKTMVFAMSKRNMNANIPVMFRSYPALANSGPNCTIWEALYATMAHPDLFDSIDIGDYPLQQSFVGGEIGNSNPIAHVLSEVRSIYLGRYISCVLSIGAGHPATIHISDSQMASLFRTKELVAMKHMATDSERVAEDMVRRFEEVPGVYFRLNVNQGMQNVDAGDRKKLDSVLAHTRAYLNGRIQAAIKRPAAIKHCPTPTPVFTGRNHEAEEVKLCVAGGVDERRVCVIYGLGGAGKSQLAFKAIETNQDYWELVIYVNASSMDSIEDTLRNFAVVRKIGHSHTSTLDWLGSLRKRWLLVFDNIDDPSLCISDYFPHGNKGSILVTTRLPDLVVHARGPSSVILISNMNPKEALILLSKLVVSRGQILSEIDIEAATALLEDFGHLALAIVHAGAYIGHHPHMTIAEYRRLFLNERRRMLEQYRRLPVKIDNYERTVYTTWMLCYELLERRESRQLLWLIAFLYPEGITTEIFRRSSPSVRSYNPIVPLSELERAADDYIKEYLYQFQNREHWDAVVFSDVISELASYSLIGFDRNNLSYNIHILVQDWVRTIVLEQVATPGLWLERVTTLLSRSIGSGDIDDEASLSFKRELGPQVSKSLREHNGTVGVNHAKYFAEVFKARGQWDEEERLRVQIIESTKAISEHPDTITMKQLDDLVTVYRNQGKWSKAEPLCSYLWETRKGTSNEHEFETETIASAVSLIEILQKQTRLEQARELYQKVEEQYFEWLIDPYLVALNDLTLNPELVLHHRGSLASRLFEVAKELDHDQRTLINTVTICESILRDLTQANARNQTHAAVLKLIEGAATLGVQSGCFDMAKTQYKMLLRSQELVLGIGHKEVQKTMQNLADVYLKLGKWEHANEVQRRIFDVCERTSKNTTLTRIAPCVIITHILSGKWRQAFWFMVRAASPGPRNEANDAPGRMWACKEIMKCTLLLLAGTLILISDLARYDYVHSQVTCERAENDQRRTGPMSKVLISRPKRRWVSYVIDALSSLVYILFSPVLSLLERQPAISFLLHHGSAYTLILLLPFLLYILFFILPLLIRF